MKRNSTWAEAVRELAVVVLVPALLLGTVPVSAAAAPAPRRDTRAKVREAAPRPQAAPAPAVQVNRRRPRVEPAPSFPQLSTQPTADELTHARIFSEPLLPLGGEPEQEDTATVAAAVAAFVSRGGADTQPLEQLLDQRRGGAWQASLWLNLGLVYLRQGRFTRATVALGSAWELARDMRDERGRVVADQAIGELLALHTMFGREGALASRLAEIEGRELRGQAAEQALHAQHAAWGLQYRHHEATPSGPVALSQLLRVVGGGRWDDARLSAFHATPDGASLSEMHTLANEVGLRLRMAYREPGAEMVWPALMHLRGSHFSAVVVRVDGRYKLADPLLGGEVWLSRLALEEEASGYFLVPAGRPLPAGWRAVGEDEAQAVRGKCKYPEPHPRETGCSNNQQGGNGGGGNCSGNACSPGLATYSMHALAVSLRVVDTPVGYTAAVGPGVYFTLAYNQREATQPGTFTHSNLGRRWTHEFLAYVQDDATNPWAKATVVLSGGGSEDHLEFDGQAYEPARRSRAVLRRVSSSPIVYERQLPDGSKEIYGQSDGAVGTSRRVFLTQRVDPQGNDLSLTYDEHLRLVAITDALGLVTTLGYEHPDTLKITRVTDPYGRSARFEYGPDGYLERITDVIGLMSEFEYGASDFMRALTTPYGTTRFQSGFEKIVSGGHVIAARWWLEATDPLGGRERLEFSDASTLAHMDAAASVPQGFHTLNKELNKRNSFYWDKRAMASVSSGTPPYELAQVTHWLFEGSINYPQHALIADTKHSEKRALEGRVWYDYIEEGAPQTQSMFDVPVKIGRVLDDGSSQIHRYEYNDRGRVTRATDPVGRTTLYVYASNGIDLQEVRQVNGAGTELLSRVTHSPANPHVPASVTDTAGQTTSYTHDASGRLETIVTPARNGPSGTPLSLAERTTTYAYYPDNAALGAGRLQTITGPMTAQGAPVTSYTYDANGRVRTTTDPDSYTRTYDYDLLDRTTRVTYPDATYEETVYNRLDAEKRRDRLGRWSHTFHDALRRVVAVRDAAGRTTTQVWCPCGSLDKLIDANGNATAWGRDVQGRVIQETRADGKTKEFVYEGTTSRLKLVRDFMTPKQEKQYEYFIDDNLKQVSYLGAVIPTPSVSHTYDAAYNRPLTMTDGVGLTIYGYHPIAVTPVLGAGRLASVDGPLSADTVSYTYDELGRVATRGLVGFNSTFKYDALGRLVAQVSPVGSFTYGYDGVTERRLAVAYPNGQTTAYAYFLANADHRLQEIKHLAPGGGLLSKFNYTYDAVGNIQAWRQEYAPDPAQVYEFGYDAADQLTAATLKSTDPTPVVLKRYGYAYDPAGNRTAEQIDDVVRRSTHNNRNQLLTTQAGGALLFRGSVNEPATVTVQGKPATVTATNRFEGAAQTANGTSTVVVQATDPSGNARANTYQVTQTGTCQAS